MRLWIFTKSYTIFYGVATYLSSAVASVTPTGGSMISSHHGMIHHGMVHHCMVHHGMIRHRVVSHAWHMSVTAVVRHGCWTGRCLTTTSHAPLQRHVHLAVCCRLALYSGPRTWLVRLHAGVVAIPIPAKCTHGYRVWEREASAIYL